MKGLVGSVVSGFLKALSTFKTRVEVPPKVVTKKEVKDISLPVIEQLTDDATDVGLDGLDIVQAGVVFVIVIDVGICNFMNEVVDKLFQVMNENVNDIGPETIRLSALMVTLRRMFGFGVRE